MIIIFRLFQKKKNFNMIPIPKNLKPLNTEYKKNIFNENKSRNLNKCPSIKRVFKNIDINRDYFSILFNKFVIIIFIINIFEIII